MNTISDLRIEIATTSEAIVAVMRKKPLNGDSELKSLAKLHKTLDTLEPKIQEETLVLRATYKECSPTLIRYNAKLQVLRDEFKKFLVTITPTPVPVMRPLDIKKESFRRFLRDRVRLFKDGYEELLIERVTLKEVMKAYNRWLISGNGKKLDSKEIELLLDEEVCNSRGKFIWSHIKVFLDEDDLEEFENDHKELMTKEKSLGDS